MGTAETVKNKSVILQTTLQAVSCPRFTGKPPSLGRNLHRTSFPAPPVPLYHSEPPQPRAGGSGKARGSAGPPPAGRTGSPRTVRCARRPRAAGVRLPRVKWKRLSRAREEGRRRFGFRTPFLSLGRNARTVISKPKYRPGPASTENTESSSIKAKGSRPLFRL